MRYRPGNRQVRRGPVKPPDRLAQEKEQDLNNSRIRSTLVKEAGDLGGGDAFGV